jgi:hypothetical protein
MEDRVGTLDLPLPAFIPRRYRPDLSAWSAHLAFANDLISALRPSLIVELGTHYGESYFGFCQSVAENGLDCLCYAIDHWLGEEHAGYYGEEVMEDVRRHNDAYYKSFSYLLRTSFDDALNQFADETIELLHIDGLHTYEAVSQDFRGWLRKVKPGGIVLIHDIAARHDDFGVWRLWNELTAEVNETFAFHHSWGLGVLRKPGRNTPRPRLLELLFDSRPAVQEYIRRHYVLYASHLENVLRSNEETTSAIAGAPSSSVTTTAEALVQVFPFGREGYSEDTSAAQCVEFGQWKTLTFDLPEGIGDGPLRIDPADCPCIVELGRLSITSQESGTVMWSAEDAAVMRSLRFSELAALLPREDRCLLLSYGDDPTVLLPPLAFEHGPMRVTISLRLDRAFDAVCEALNAEARAHAELIESRTATNSEIAGFRAELSSVRAELTCVQGELSKVTVERNDARREMRMLEPLLESTRFRLQQESSQKIRLETELMALRESVESELTRLRSGFESERANRMAMEGSRSWRLTKPMRRFMSLLRR